jgi:gliding motility-associated protein GldL
MSQNASKFDIWWNSPSVKRFVGIAYSLGASVVIIGAMGKILHTSWGGAMLGLGMGVEAMLFALGAFDKPHKEMDWDNSFHFDEHGKIVIGGGHQAAGTSQTQAKGQQLETISDDDMKKLSEGIKNLTNTADQFSSLTKVVGATEQFTKNIDAASQVTGKFVQSQESLNGASTKLAASYVGVSTDMEEVVKNTKLYSGKVEDVTKNLSSINSIYEIQLKNINAQAEALTQQTEKVRLVSSQIESVLTETQKIKAATTLAATETEKYKDSAQKLSKQIADLNQVYGNMLNALN